MSYASRGARAAARSLRRSIQHQSRRNASDHGHGHGHGDSAFHVADGPTNESFGKGFYVTMALIPLGYLTYTLATSPEDNMITRAVAQYNKDQEAMGNQTVLHATMMEAALKDRQLFKGANRDTSGPDTRFTESFNTGSPWNVIAGQGTADLSLLMEHYEEKNKAIEDARLARMEDGKVVTVYDGKYDDRPEVQRKQYRATK